MPRKAIPATTAAILALVAGSASAAPVLAPIAADAPSQTVSVAASPLGGWRALGDSTQDRVQIRDIRSALRSTISAAQIQALVPWMTLSSGADGVGALAFSASGRFLFIAVHDDTLPPDGLGSDAILRLDVSTGALTLFARLNIASNAAVAPRLSMLHHRGLLFVGTEAGQIVVLSASAALSTGAIQATWTLPGAGGGGSGGLRGMALDRDSNQFFLASQSALYRTTIPASLATAPIFTTLSAAGADIRAITFADHFGAPSQRGLYVLSGVAPASSRIQFLSAAAALGSGATPTLYTTLTDSAGDLAFAPDGSIQIATDSSALRLTETVDTRLGFDAWLSDEFAQSLAFARSLVSPDGEPAGWVIDADVIPSFSRFHPATPDAAAWAVLMLIMSTELTTDPAAQALAQAQTRTILTRYAGLAPDNIRPLRNPDGHYKHWIDPLTGTTKATWPDEFASLSTMKLVLAAARATARFPDDPVIVRAASIIVFRVRNYDTLFQAGTDAYALKLLPSGGPDTSSWSRPFNEGIMFAEQAGVYGGSSARIASGRWFNRALWPTATFIPGRPITSTGTGVFEAGFLTVYPLLLSAPFRASPAWSIQVENVRWSNAAWSDDNPGRYAAMFSAGTSPIGYNADSLTNRPGDITTFTTLMGLSATGEVNNAAGAYAAFRKGARQTFKGGASILYRRPVDAASTYVPNSAGLPDVSHGALGLAELIRPGSVAKVLARDYPTREQYPFDLTGDGRFDIDDVYAWFAAPADVNADLLVNTADLRGLVNWARRNEPRDSTGR